MGKQSLAHSNVVSRPDRDLNVGSGPKASSTSDSVSRQEADEVPAEYVDLQTRQSKQMS